MTYLSKIFLTFFLSNDERYLSAGVALPLVVGILTTGTSELLVFRGEARLLCFGLWTKSLAGVYFLDLLGVNFFIFSMYYRLIMID